jgi:hypothetical protein
MTGTADTPRCAAPDIRSRNNFFLSGYLTLKSGPVFVTSLRITSLRLSPRFRIRLEPVEDALIKRDQKSPALAIGLSVGHSGIWRRVGEFT